MTTFHRVQGDTNDTIVATLNGVDDFTAATVEAHVWRADTASTNLDATVTPTGACTVELGSWITTAAAGTWYLEYEVTFGDGTIITWPADKPDGLVIRADGA